MIPITELNNCGRTSDKDFFLIPGRCTLRASFKGETFVGDFLEGNSLNGRKLTSSTGKSFTIFTPETEFQQKHPNEEPAIRATLRGDQGENYSVSLKLKKKQSSKIESIAKQLSGKPLRTSDGRQFTIAVGESFQHKHAGQSPQIKASLVGKNGETIPVRIKRITNMNEAFANHQIFSKDDPLKAFLPTFYGALSPQGDQFDEDVLSQRKTKYRQTAYIILRDLSDPLNNPEVSDFKFADPALIHNEREREVHEHKPLSPLQYVPKIIFGSLFSFRSFNYSCTQHQTTSNLFIKIIVNNVKKLFSYLKTRHKLEHHFMELSIRELTKTITKLEILKKSVLLSEFTFIDSSLLFISRDIDGEKRLDISLIDMNHTIGKSEAIGETEIEKLQKISADSIQKIIIVAKEIQMKNLKSSRKI